MPRAPVNGVELHYETFGDPADPTVLLVSGLGAQMITWFNELCQMLVDRGLHVVRFDNRDVGLSTHLDEPVDVMAVLGGVGTDEIPAVPYLLAEMADDAAGLLDHLGVESAHVAGVSMGGMIAQTLAIRHPARVATLTSIMSTTGEPHVGAPTAEAMTVLLEPPPETREATQDAQVRHAKVWGSPGLYDEGLLRQLAGDQWDRDSDTDGAARQLAAILASGSRADDLAGLEVPTLVIHGTADTLVQPSGGERTAEVIPDAKLMMIEGMGHDLAPPLWPHIVDALATHVTEHAERS